MSLDSSRSPEGAFDEVSARRDRGNELVCSLFSECYALLVRYAFRATRSLASAEEIVQDSFADFFRAVLEGKVIENPKGWLLCAVKREGIDRLRQEERHGGAFTSLTDTMDLPHQFQEPPVAPLDDRLGALLGALTRREEEVLLLRAKSLKYRQIATTLGISTNSVKTLLARAIRKMQKASKAQTEAQTRAEGYGRDIPKTLQ